MQFWDRKAQITAPLDITPNARGKWPNLAGYRLVHWSDSKSVQGWRNFMAVPAISAVKYNSFQQYSQLQAAEANKETVEIPIPAEYKQLLAKYPDITKCDFMAKTVKHGVIHHIDTGSNPPCRAKVRQLMPGSPKAIQGEKEWRHLQKLGIVAEVDPQETNLWTSALHLAPKPDGSLRPCGDFRQLNDKTLLDGFPLPNLRHFMGEIKGSTVFSKIDLVKAFHQIPLDEESQRKSCVVTPWGAFVFKRLAMGLRNSAQSFQRLITHVLGNIPGIFVYMDDVLIYSKSNAQHRKTIDEIFKRLNDNGMAISLKKCVFEVSELDFVGYRVTRDGITPLPRKLEAIVKFPSPTKQKHLLGFLGAINYYRRCLPVVDGKTPAQTLQPLYDIATKKLQPGTSFSKLWSEGNLQVSFDEAKKLLANATLLVHPDPNAPLALTTDAFATAIGGVLEQFVEGHWQPLGFWSNHLSKDKIKWTTYRRELLAIQQALRHFRTETDGRHVVVFTDHRPILGSLKSHSANENDPVAQNAINEISQFTSDIHFLAGKSNAVADWLSRPPDVPIGTAYALPAAEESIGTIAAVKEDLSLELISHKALAAAQAVCPEVLRHRQGQCPKSVTMSNIEFSPGVHLYCDTSTGTNRPLVPAAFRPTIMAMFQQVAHCAKAESIRKVSHLTTGQTSDQMW